MSNAKDTEQDLQIRHNAERITRNEEAIKRQTEALEQIRDHYYPPPERLWKRTGGFFIKVLCVVLAYAGGVQAVDWYVNVRKSAAMAKRFAQVAERLFFAEGNATGAVRFYEKALELEPADADYHSALLFMKGMAFSSNLLDAGRPLTAEELERTDEALADAAMLMDADDDDPMPYILKAQALLVRGEKDEAVRAVERAAACGADRASVRVSACAINFFAGRPAEARAHLAAAERLDATLPLIPGWKGILALAARDLATARAQFETITRRAPRLAMGHAFLGRALLAGPAADVKAARAAFARALVCDARQKMALLGTAETYEREGNLAVARLWLDRALAFDANSVPALLARARVNGKTGDGEAAVADLSAAIALAPLRKDLYALRANACERVGDAKRAKADRATAAALD